MSSRAAHVHGCQSEALRVSESTGSSRSSTTATTSCVRHRLVTLACRTGRGRSVSCLVRKLPSSLPGVRPPESVIPAGGFPHEGDLRNNPLLHYLQTSIRATTVLFSSSLHFIVRSQTTLRHQRRLESAILFLLPSVWTVALFVFLLANPPFNLDTQAR